MEFIRNPYTQLRVNIENAVRAWVPGTANGIPLGPPAQTWLDTLLRHLQGPGGMAPDQQPSEIYGPELIYAYWLEEGMLIQSMEAVALRFQNRNPAGQTALANLDISPLRPISDWLWAFIDDQHRRLGLKRRAYEYAHQYGLRLVGKAIGEIRPADDRSPFLLAFHSLLNACMRFFRELDDLNVQQDARPVLNCLKELQMILLQGSSNQFGTIPTQARVEVLLMQHLLGAPEIVRFLGAPLMVNYPQPWMGPVDTLRKLMQWGDASIIEFWNLAVFGELIVFSTRWGAFDPAQVNAIEAENWAASFRDPITQYVHSYRAVTGVDLAQELVSGQSVDATMPSVYLSQRENEYRRRRAG